MSGMYSLSGLPVRRWRLVRGTTYRPPISTRRTSVVQPGRDGEVPIGLPRFESTAVSLVLRPGMEQSAAALEILNDDLSALMAQPSLTLTRFFAGSTRQAEVRLVSAIWDTKIVWGIWSGVTLALDVPGVFFRDPTWSTREIPAGASTHTVLAGSAPISDAVVRFGPFPLAGSVVSLTDTLTGTGLSSDYAAAEDHYLYLDAGRMLSWNSSSSTNWTGGFDRSQHLDYPAAGPLQLWPSVHEDGDDLIREVSVQASHACMVRYRRAWL